MTDDLVKASKRFRKTERLNGKISLSRLFASGNSFVVYPYRVVCLFSESDTAPFARVMVSVPKRNFKRAVKRNLIRRRIKEAYRLQKQPVLDCLAGSYRQVDVAFLYIGKEVGEYGFLERKMAEALNRIRTSIPNGGFSPVSGTKGVPD